MKRASLLLLLLALPACGGGGSDPAKPEPNEPPPVIVSGTFNVTSQLTTNGCDQSTIWDGAYDVVIDSLSFSMGSWTGTWDPTKVFGTGDSVKDITYTRNCKATRWSTVYVTFLSEDKFRGTVYYRLRLGGDCGDRVGCTSSWTIVGTRQ